MPVVLLNGLSNKKGFPMKRIILALSLLATPAFAQQAQQYQPTPQAQLFSIQRQLSIMAQDDQSANEQAFDLSTKLQDAQSKITELQKKLDSLSKSKSNK